MGLTKTSLFSEKQNEIATTAKVLAHPARIAIIDYLLNSSSCINSDLVEEIGLAQATISQHLNELKAIGIIQGTIEGKAMNYCINPNKWNEIQQNFNSFFNKLPKTNCC